MTPDDTQAPASCVALRRLLREMRACTVCAAVLPQPAPPVLQAGSAAHILIAQRFQGQIVMR